MNVELLYPLVTEAILRAEVLEDLRAPGAKSAHLDVSLIEEKIAELLPAANPEGAVARRGAVRAALAAKEYARAQELATRFATGTDVDSGLRDELNRLAKEAVRGSSEQDRSIAEPYPQVGDREDQQGGSGGPDAGLSLTELYEQYAPRLTRFFVRRRFTPEDAQDLTQETFMSVFLKVGALREREKFESWLFTIAFNKNRNARRDRATARRHLGDASVTEEPDEGAGPPAVEDPLARPLVEEEHRLLRQALLELSPELRNTVLLRLDLGLTYHEIAAVLRVPLGTAKSRLNAAAEQLRRLLGGSTAK